MSPTETAQLNTQDRGIDLENQSPKPSDGDKHSQQRIASSSQNLWQAIQTIVRLQNQAPPLVPVNRYDDLPLSFTQERLWLLAQLEPNSSAYNIPFALRLHGPLNLSALQQAFHSLLERHEALRTTFASVRGKSIQVIAPPASTPLTLVDLHSLPPADREDQLQHLMAEEARRPFDLNQGPLFRATLLQLDPSEHVLLITVHHIVFDGWSEGILWRELAAFYDAAAGEPSLAALPIQYGDFAVWQRQWLQGEFLETLLSYWKQQLTGKLYELQLPTDHARPQTQTRRSACLSLILSAELTTALKALSRQAGATLFATLLAAFKVLLQHYTAQESLFVCSPIANRNRKELQGLMGYFVNLLILHSDLSGDPSFRDLCQQVRQTVSSAYAHQDLPVQQLLSHLDGAQVSLSQVMFVLQNTPQQVPSLSGLTVEPLPVDNGTADFDLSLSLVEESGCLRGVLKYNTDLFEEPTIRQMLQHFELVLQQCVADPDQPISTLLPLNDTEQDWLQQARSRSVQAVLSNQNSDQREYVAPRDDVESQLAKIWERVLNIQPIGIHDNFFELGGRSLVATHLFAEIEKTFGKDLPLATLFQAPTIAQLADLLRQTEQSASWRSLVAIKPTGSKPPLYFIHAGGGGLMYYRDLAYLLGPDQPFYGLESLGMDGKQECPDTIEKMAAHYVREIRAFQPEGPYFVGGLCFGGLIAYEVAQQLQAQGQAVPLLLLFNTMLPSACRRSPLYARLPRHLMKLAKEGPAYILQKAKGKTHQWRKKDRKKRKPFKVRPIQPTGQPLSHTQRHLPVREIHEKARISYVPKVYPGRVTLFQATGDREREGYDIEPQWGWSKLAGGGLEIHPIPGKHNALLVEPHIQVQAQKLKACLEKLQSEL